MSADYALRLDGRWVVVKFRAGGARAEAEALRAWKKAGANVVAVLNEGILPSTVQSEQKVEFLVLQAAVNQQNQLGQTAQEFLRQNPDQMEEIGHLSGGKRHPAG